MTRTFQSKDTKTSTTSRRGAAQDVQTKMKVGSSGDRYEKEADQTADKVLRKKAQKKKQEGTESDVAKGISRLGGDFGKEKKEKVQKKEAEEAQTKIQKAEEEEAQAKKKEEKVEDKVQKMDDKEKAQKKQEEEEAQTKVQKAEEEEAQAKKKEEKAEDKVQKMDNKEKAQKKQEEEEAQTKVQKAEEEEAQTKKKEEKAEDIVQKMDDKEKAQKKEKEEAQTKVQKAEEEEAQAKEEKKEEKAEDKVQKIDDKEKAQKKEEEEAQTKVQKTEEEEAQAKKKEEKAEDIVQKMDDKEKTQKKEEEEEAQTEVQKAEEEEAQAKTETRASIRDKRSYPVINDIEPRLIASRGRGEKMTEDVRIDMEARFGADFSKVRIHTDSRAESMTSDMEAQAFTSGKDIYFNDGKYDPESDEGRKLLAHELTHVIQQGEAEAKVPESKIAEANSQRNESGSMPPDKEAMDAKEQLEKEKKEVAEIEPERPDKLKADDSIKKAKLKEKKGSRKKKKAKKEPKDEPKTAVGAFLKETSKAKVKKKMAGLEKLAENETEKDDAGTKLSQTEKSVVPPAEEGQSKSNASQVDTVNKTEEPKPDEEKAKENLKKAMEASIPNSLEQADKFKEEGKGRVVGEEVRSSVTADTQEVQTTYQEIENTPEPEPEPTPDELPEMEVAPVTPPLDLGDDVIGEVQPEHTDMSEFEQKTDDDMAKEEISEEQLEMVDSGPLAEAKEGRKKQKEKVQSGPKEVKQLEKQEKDQVKQDMKKEEKAGKKKMQEERKEKLKNTQEKQKKTKKTIEDKRKEVTDHINGIYEKTNEDVKKKLDDLEKQSLKAFDDGQAQATKTFEDNVKRRLDAFKDDRYSGMFGWARWLKDKLLGMDDLPQVKRIFDEEKATFISNIDKLISKITEDNKKVIQECKDMVQKARETIAEYVANLGPALKDVGQQAQADMQAKLDDLDKQVAAKEEELKKKLEEKREAAIKAIEEKIESMKEEMSGLAGKLAALLLAALVKLFKWAIQKIGGNSDTIMAKIDKGKAVIKKIVKSPGTFLGNIGKAVKLGFQLFGKNIKKHLLNGLVEWLAGPLGDTGLKMPDKFDLPGVMSLGLQILGLTWERIREKVIKVGKVPEKVLEAAEKGLDIIKQIKEKGFIVLWDMLKEKAEELKQKVIEGIAKFAAVQIIKAAVIKLLMMLNPAGALLQIALTIYDAVMWFIDNIDRIIDFIKSVFNSIVEIAMGQIGKAGAFIEKALAKTVPILLSFIARWLKLDGIGKAIKKIITKVRKPIDKVMDKIIKFIAKKVKKLFGKAKKGAKKVKDKAKAGVKSIVNLFKKKKKITMKDGNKHTIYCKKKGGKTKVYMSSAKETDLQSLNPKEKKDALKAAITKSNTSAAKAAKNPNNARKVKSAINDIDKIANILSSLSEGDIPELGKYKPLQRIQLFKKKSPYQTQKFEKSSSSEDEKPLFKTKSGKDGRDILESSLKEFKYDNYNNWLKNNLKTGVGNTTWRGDRNIGRRTKSAYAANVGSDDKSYVFIGKKKDMKPTVHLQDQAKNINEELKKQVQEKGLIAFLIRLAKSGVTISGKLYSKNNIDKFRQDFFSGGIAAANKKFLARQVRGGNQHEWLPTSNLVDALEKDIQSGNFDNGIERARFIDFQKQITSETYKIVFNPFENTLIKRGNKIIPQGHSGAIYYNGEPQTKDQNIFHNKLREEFKEDIKDANDLMEGIRSVADEWVWDGTGLDKNNNVHKNVEHRKYKGKPYKNIKTYKNFLQENKNQIINTDLKKKVKNT